MTSHLLSYQKTVQAGAIQMSDRHISIMSLFMNMILPKKSGDKCFLMQIWNQEGQVALVCFLQNRDFVKLQRSII